MIVMVRFRQVENLEDGLEVHEQSCQWMILRLSVSSFAFIIWSAITPFQYFLYLHMQVECQPTTNGSNQNPVRGVIKKIILFVYSFFFPAAVPELMWFCCDGYTGCWRPGVQVVIWSTGSYGHLVNMVIWSIWSSGHLVIWSSGHRINMVIGSSGHLVI